MKILDLQTGRVHEYGDSGHDSLYVSQDGTTLTYYNLQTGDGSKYGDYRFVCDDNKIPAESQTADARHCEVYFNIGGWPERPHGKWIGVVYSTNKIGVGMCNQCGSNRIIDNFCSNCGADMREEDPEQ